MNYSLYFQGRTKREQEVPLKNNYITTKVPGFTSQNALILILHAVGNSDFTAVV
jgi:hypothetical protein